MNLFLSIFYFFLFAGELTESFFFKKMFFRNHRFYSNKKNIDDIYLDYLKDYNKIDTSNNKYIGFSNNNIEKNNFKIFKTNYEKVEEINEELLLNNNTFELGFNSDFDNYLYNEPDVNLMNKVIPRNYTFKNSYEKYIKDPLFYIKNFFSIKKEFSWNDTSYLSPVKNQGRCGSCWAFASTNALETYMRSLNYTIDRLSEQELVDCSKENYGCNGGFMHKAYDFIIRNKGLVSDKDYPYVARTNKCNVCKCKDGKHIYDEKLYNEIYGKDTCCDEDSCCDKDSCNCDDKNSKLNFTEVLHLNKVNGSQLKEYEFTIPKSILDRILSLKISPITIAVDASSIYFRYYKNGVIDIKTNSTQQLNHAVLLIGYGLDDKGLYWIIQNSWGSDWGDNGYCRIRVEEGEGILLSNIYGVYPSKI